MTPAGQDTHIIAYEPNDAAIAKLKTDVAHILADPKAALATKKGYEDAKTALALTRSMRGILEKKRVELKADALEYGRKVDSKAKEVLAKIMEIEGPIKTAKDEVDAAEEKKRLDAIAAEKAKQEAEEKAKRDAEEARLKAIRDEEEKRLKEEREAIEAERRKMAEEKAAEDARRKAEDDARRAEQAKIDAEAKAERERLAVEQKKIDDEKARLAKIEADRLAKEKAEQEKAERAEFERVTREKAEKEAKERAEAAAKAASEKAERDRIAAEKAAKEKAEAEKAEAARLEAAKPDQKRIQLYGESITEFINNCPEVKGKDAADFLANIRHDLSEIATRCVNYTTPKKAK